jgi:hypothetical protein
MVVSILEIEIRKLVAKGRKTNARSNLTGVTVEASCHFHRHETAREV